MTVPIATTAGDSHRDSFTVLGGAVCNPASILAPSGSGGGAMFKRKSDGAQKHDGAHHADGGLQFDLAIMEARLRERRCALNWLLAGGTGRSNGDQRPISLRRFEHRGWRCLERAHRKRCGSQ